MRTLAVGTVIAAAAIWAYAPSFRGVFVYDDKVAIVQNPNVRSVWPLTSAMSAPAESPVSARPMASLSLAINYALAPADVRDVMAPAGPADPPGTNARYLRNLWGYHAMNLALHTLTALAVFGVVRRTLLTEKLRAEFGDAATWLGLATATIWAVHPVTTDAVTYLAQRTEVLMGLFFSSTLYFAIRGLTAPATVACLAGMASKQTMVTAPIVVWTWDWMFLPDGARRRPARRILYFALATTWVLLGALVAYERWPTSIGFALEGWTPWTYLLTQTTVIAHYARLAILGGPLALDYDGWPMSQSVAGVLPYALPLAVMLAVTVIGVVRRRAWAFPLAVWFAALAPSSSILPLATEIAAERRMYLPLAALIALAVAVGFHVGRRVVPQVAQRATALVALVGIVFTFGSMTASRNRDFWSEENIWRDTVEKRPGNSRARLNYGVSLAASRRTTEAEQQLREAVRLKETNAAAHLNLGSLLASHGRPEEGVVHLERALAIDPDYTAAFHNLGEAYGALGKREQAAKYFSLAVEARPDDPFLLNRLGWLLATSPEDGVRDGARATAIAERAVGLTQRRDATSLDTLAAAYAETGRFDEAVKTVREAISVAGRQGPRELVPELEVRLGHYQSRRPFRENL